MVIFRNNITAIALLFLILHVSASSFFRPWKNIDKQFAKSILDETLPFLHVANNIEATQAQLWFSEQRLDHFNITNNQTWSQRYWVINQYYNKASQGPVFLMICGEATCKGLTQQRLFPLELAKQYEAMILVLEHRFYGQSQPFGKEDLTTSRLSYLTVDQALGDIAYFINYVKHAGNFSLTAETKFITIGGSYAGALSAFFREKYPYLTVGALASSAVVNSFIDFPEFDEQVYTSLLRSGNECTFSVETINKYVEEKVYDAESESEIKAQFNASKLTNEEFLFYWADSVALLVQYGHRTELCNLLSSFGTIEAQFDALKKLLFTLELSNATDYGSYYLKDVEFDEENDGSRQWTWQVCSELGWFNTAPTNRSIHSLRSRNLNITFYKNWCKEIFGVDVWPTKGLANLYHGGKNIKATNLIITNGVEDPWQHASIIKSNSSGIVTYYIDCENCGHCVDLSTPNDDDSWRLWWTRLNIRYNIGKWLLLTPTTKEE